MILQITDQLVRIRKKLLVLDNSEQVYVHIITQCQITPFVEMLPLSSMLIPSNIFISACIIAFCKIGYLSIFTFMYSCLFNYVLKI